MKCCIMQHFNRFYTVCKGKNYLQTKDSNIFSKLQRDTPEICTIDPSKHSELNKKEKFISIQRVKKESFPLSLYIQLDSGVEDSNQQQQILMCILSAGSSLGIYNKNK